MRKNFLKLAACSTLLLVNIKANAVTPRNDWYAGIFLGPSATAASSFDFGQPINFEGPNVQVSASSGRITYSVLGGIGGQIGYRFCNRHRIEGEFYYNNNPIRQLQLYDYTLSNTYFSSLNESVYLKEFNNLTNTSDAHIQGDTNTGAFMLNFIYDFFNSQFN